MAKRKRKTNKMSRERRLKEGRGQGILGDYKPYIYVQDIASKGLSARVRGNKTGRVHHLLSKLETHAFYCLDWQPQVIDIREQFPLDLQETLAIAEKLKISHQRVPDTLEDVVITTDFLVTVHDTFGPKDIAFSVKYSNELSEPRVLEKLDIERYYWTRRDIDWRIITEKQINPTFVANIKWVHQCVDLNRLSQRISLRDVKKTEKFMFGFLRNTDSPLRDITALSDRNFSFTPGTSLSIVRHLIAVRKWIVDMRKPIQPEIRLPILNSQFTEVIE